ncbi:glycosyltransferase [Spirosoma sp. RP8]|uniref:Glycosyltransferase n=1 Tax=Spirosoma liriopis TaxID=2937440 RepID=A0ABT0HPI1_9BACT|nr:glycosyltransferase [Spirosoma liriopis]MCK8494086.1 glycosyltransferase [Spirosoma liriopis]
MLDVTAVIVTRNRVDTLLWTIGKLVALPEQPPIIVVDNASTDGTPEKVRALFPDVTVVALTENRACSARNEGVRRAKTALITFCDDDSFWVPGALHKAVSYFEQYPHLGVLAGKVLVGEDEAEDPVCHAMQDSPITDPRPLPGPAILGFVCCAVVVRREAFLSVGGFHNRFAIAGEERLFSVDMRTIGWSLAYAADVVAHHYPSKLRNNSLRTRHITRDTIWYYWLRRPFYYALRHTLLILKAVPKDVNIRKGFVDALQAAPTIVASRRVVPSGVEEQILKIESFY